MSDTDRNYIYVDAQFGNELTGKKTKWIRMKMTDVRRMIVVPSGNRNCTTTVQRYRDAVSLREFEARAALAQQGKPVMPAKGPPPSDEDLAEGQFHYLGVYFDFDCNPDKLEGSESDRRTAALKRSLDDARKVVDYFRVTHQVPDHLINCWFSGKKGFHVIVHPGVFGIQPHRHLTTIVKMAVGQLQDTLSLSTLDMAVYTLKGRQWRIPNSIHPGSGLFKVEVTPREILDWGPEQFLKLASRPRNEIGTEEVLPPSHIYPASQYRDVSVLEDSLPWWQQFVDLYQVRLDMDRLRPQRPITRPLEGGDEYPACMKDLIDNGPKPTGPNRNKVVLPMVGFLADAGVEKDEAMSMMKDWTKRYYPDPKELTTRLINISSVIHAGYSGKLHFSCRAIRANSGGTAEEKVACVGADKCKWIRDATDQDPVQVPTVHLAEADKGCYINTKVRVPVQVATRAAASYGVPLKGKVVCTPGSSGELCNDCVNGANGSGGKLTFQLSADDSKVLDLIGVNTNEKTAEIRKFCKIPLKCFKNAIVYDEHTNLEEVELIPMVDYSRVYMQDDERGEAPSAEEEVIRTKKGGTRHVVQRAFYMGHGIQPNKKYMVEASVFNFPKTQHVVLLFDKMESSQADIDQFVMTPDRYESLKAFRPREGQSVKEKMHEIHADLTANIHQIGGRMDISIAIDLCYHSAVGFKLDGKWVDKGWWELLIVGDTATGKSTMIKRVIQHYGMGEMTNGEGAGRTGLVFAMIPMNNRMTVRWGKIPQNDRGLLVIDEFSGMDEEEAKKLTQVRSEGKASASGQCSGHEAPARTRLIFLTNPKGGNAQLSDHNSGIHAVRRMFKEGSDLRRIDLAVVADSSEVGSDVINRRWSESNVHHFYTSDLCHSLLMWAWSREPEHITWKEGAEERVAHHAREMGEVYRCDITLADLGDLRLKIARIAISVAIRLFSTDNDARKVYVGIEHVDYAVGLMDFSYRKKAMGFFEYARRYKEMNQYTEERKELIRSTLMKLEDAKTIISILAEAETIQNKPQLADMLNLEKPEMDKLWKFMNAKGLLKKDWKGWHKTPAFNELLKVMNKSPSVYRGEFGEGFAEGILANGSAPKKPEPQPDIYVGPIPTLEVDADDPGF